MLLSNIFSLLAVSGIVAAAPTELEARQSGNFKAEMIEAHNFFRGQHSAQPLTWNENLANKAQSWANTCNWSHSGSGENLASGTGFTSWGAFVNLWGAERKQYNYAQPGFSSATGHFTQVVWKNSKTLGCGWKKCGGGQGKASGWYIVCHYSPAGNYLGQFPQNVARQTKGKPTDVWQKRN
ncbi:extracellular SCP domain-containing protein Pry1 [Pochonia chlamydosporia 170]|uniref:Extracellular SCP domain-containing protein Pry1 n=1 Tax=Pochonia chlamydosporia 170 TaxID=1380566 RepID=A0A179FUF6_METCM|nr:extracellular SCP domain-containing protein Pry1 [Pochonia chlamydosporia 170]OAQ68639.1 extracellular SCP domain-containing protein Pry1 [Pochonia chlamydosporia 170]